MTEIGVYKDGVWYQDWNGDGAFNAGIDNVFNFGATGWIPVVGDWSGNGITKIGVTNGQQWYLDENGNGVWDYVVDYSYSFGAPGWTPIVGKWS
jgi:hypothetical protein